MDVDWNAEVVDQIDAHWRDRLRPRLSGLTDDEYFWQPVPDCWTVSRRGQSSAPISFGGGEFTMDYAEPPHDPLGLGEAQGAPPAFADAPMARKILYTNVELIHHGAEVCLLRDLFLHSGRQ